MDGWLCKIKKRTYGWHGLRTLREDDWFGDRPSLQCVAMPRVLLVYGGDSDRNFVTFSRPSGATIVTVPHPLPSSRNFIEIAHVSIKRVAREDAAGRHQRADERDDDNQLYPRV